MPNKLGLHARVAARISKSLAGTNASVEIAYNSQTINANSILELMSLGAEKGSELTFYISGNDAETIKNAMDELFQNNLGDEE